MAKDQRRRFWAEAALSTAAAILAVLTLISPAWIELLTGWDPDHGDGSIEWIVVAVMAAVALTLGLAAREEWRRARPATGTGS
jgi:hypothetical protein